MSDWVDVTNNSGKPGAHATLRKTRDDGCFAEVWRVADVVGWSVWTPEYETAVASGHTATVEAAMTSAEMALDNIPRYRGPRPS